MLREGWVSLGEIGRFELPGGVRTRHWIVSGVP